MHLMLKVYDDRYVRIELQACYRATHNVTNPTMQGIVVWCNPDCCAASITVATARSRLTKLPTCCRKHIDAAASSWSR